MTETVVYYKPGCPFGIRLRAALTLQRVPHRSVRFRDDEVGAARVRDVNDGLEISPTVEVAGRWLTNPHWRDGVFRVRLLSLRPYLVSAETHICEAGAPLPDRPGRIIYEGGGRRGR